MSHDIVQARKNEPDDTFPRARYRIRGLSEVTRRKTIIIATHAFRGSIEVNQ